MRYHPRVSEPVLDPAEARAQFRCCPRCGAALATPGACPLVCTACRFAYYFNPAVSAAGILLRDDGRALFIRRGHEPGLGRLAFAGGFVDAGETPEAALRREVREETGLDIAVGRFLEVFERVEHDDDGAVRFHFVVLDYAATVVGGTLRAGDDAADVALVDPADLDGYGLAESVRRVISAAMQSTPAGRAGR